MFKFNNRQIKPLLATVCLLLTGLLTCQSAFAVKRALVIGNADYGNGAELGPAPLNDARDFKQVLVGLGFKKTNITLELNVKTQADFESIIREFSQKITSADEVVFYYSGHGVEYDGDNYLIPTRAIGAVGVPAHLKHKALGLESYLMTSIEHYKPRVSAIFLDACRDNPFKSIFTKSLDRKDGLGTFNGPSGSLVAYAQGSGRQALIYKKDRNSLFTKHLLRELKAGGVLTSVLTRVRSAVRKETANKQEPQFLSLLNEDGYCLGDASCASAPVVVTPEPMITEPVITKPELSRQHFEPEMEYIKGGSFDMGDLSKGKVGFDNELPVHKVSMGDFWVGKTEITFAQWNVCVKAGVCQKADDEGWGQGERPVINVNWNDTQDYIGWLNTKTGKSYRLLSESEWEYVTRAGNRTQYSWGDEIDCKKAQYRGCGGKTKAVGIFAPNAFGLYDLHGNVLEWVEDCWNGSYQNAPMDGSAWREGDCSLAVLRGGSWFFNAWLLRSADRGGNARSFRFNFIGFRLAMTR